MGRKKGTFSLSANLEVKAAAPLDPRELVDTLEDLTANDTFPYPFEGLEVYVKSEQKKYMLIGSDPTVESNWVQAGGEGGAKIFKGTVDEWDALTLEEKIEYDYTVFTDDNGGGAAAAVGVSFDERDFVENDGTVALVDSQRIFTGTQAEWDALSTAVKKTYGQANITDDESSTEGIKEYIKNQNILSDIERLAIIDNTEYTAAYDGFIHITFTSFSDVYFGAVVRVNNIIYDDVMIVVNPNGSYRHTFKIEVKKGDKWKFIWDSNSTGTSKTIVGTARYYKLRDYTGR